MEKSVSSGIKTIQEKKEMKKVAICVPVYGTITAHWFIKFINFITKNINKYIMEIIIHEDQPVSKSRESLVEMALQKNPDYILFVDSDNFLPEQTIDKLSNTMKKTEADLVTALYMGKDPPYYPVVRRYRSGGFWKIDQVEIGSLLQIDGCGFGCCLVKPSVFKDIEKPWFKFSHERWGEKDIILSEDLFFCRKMKEKNKKIICDAQIISSHIGSSVDAMEYSAFSPIRVSNMMDRDEAVADLKEFTGEDQEKVDIKTMRGPALMNQEWEEKNPQTYEEELKFYKETQNYLYDLTLWHFSQRRQFDVELMTGLNDLWMKGKETIYKDRKPKLLDFGTGIGQNAMMLCKAGFDVTIADLDSKTLDFAEFRFKKHNMPYKIWRTDKEPIPLNEKYDFILAFDVFEHMPFDKMKEYVNMLNQTKHKDTKVFISTSFGKTEAHPMHHERKEEHEALIQDFINGHVVKNG